MSSKAERTIRWTVLLGLIALTAAKAWNAAHLDLFGDEAFYWQSGQRLALSYADHPFVTAMLVRAGTEVLGDVTLGVRLFFLAIGLIFPFVIYALARPLVGAGQALLAMALSLVFLGTASLGMVAIPDVPLLLFSVLFLLLFERATRPDPSDASGPVGIWLAAGAIAALGLCTHYRFALIIVAGALYLAATTNGRARLKTRGPWLMGAVTAVGLVPFLVQNLGDDFGAATYYLAGRHGSEMDLGALPAFIGQQLLIATPFLFAALIGTYVMLWKRARAGDDRAALMCVFAGVPFLVYAGMSPFENSGLTTVHWPIVSYVPLLVFAPGCLQRFVDRPGRWRKIGASLAVGLPAILLIGGLLDYAGVVQATGLRSTFMGPSQLVAAMTEDDLQLFVADGAGRDLIVADNYKLGGQLEFALHGRADVYVMDHKKNRSHGRAPQLDVWDIGETALSTQHGRDALVVVDLGETSEKRIDAWVAHIATFFEGLEPVGEIRFEKPTRMGKPPKRYRYDLYRGVVKTSTTQTQADSPGG